MLGGGSGVVGSSDVNRSSDDGGSTGLRHDSNVGAAGSVGKTHESFASTWARGIKPRADAGDSNVGAADGVGELHESFASKWARGIKSRADAADSRRRKGREWISNVMSSRVTRDREARRDVLREGRKKLAAFQRSTEEARKSRASDWMSAHVKLGREWSPPWDRVVGALPVGDAGYSALSRSSRLCPSFS